MLETDIKNFVGLTLKNGTRKGYFVLDKPNKNCSAGSGDGSTGANFCIKSYQEFKLLNWDELLSFKGKWIDIIHNINFNSDPEKGYFKIWINGKLTFHHKGRTQEKGERIEFHFGIYRSYMSRTPGPDPTQIAYYDEIRHAKSCKKLKLKNLGYSCKEIENQSLK
jgi:hypothetical protein